MNNGVLYCLSGPSGTGKGAVCSHLVELRDMYLSISATSRNMRFGEKEGVNYFYKTREEFEKLIQDGMMLEWNEYNGNYYGTPKQYVDAELEKGRDVMLEIDPHGALNIKKQRPDAVLLFVVPPSIVVLRSRLINRGREDAEQINARIKAAKWELEQAEKYDYIIENDNLNVCVSDICDIMNQVSTTRNLVARLSEELGKEVK